MQPQQSQTSELQHLPSISYRIQKTQGKSHDQGLAFWQEFHFINLYLIPHATPEHFLSPFFQKHTPSPMTDLL